MILNRIVPIMTGLIDVAVLVVAVEPSSVLPAVVAINVLAPMIAIVNENVIATEIAI